MERKNAVKSGSPTVKKRETLVVLLDFIKYGDEIKKRGADKTRVPSRLLVMYQI
jgi:hypothetical protein